MGNKLQVQANPTMVQRKYGDSQFMIVQRRVYSEGTYIFKFVSNSKKPFNNIE